MFRQSPRASEGWSSPERTQTRAVGLLHSAISERAGDPRSGWSRASGRARSNRRSRATVTPRLPPRELRQRDTILTCLGVIRDAIRLGIVSGLGETSGGHRDHLVAHGGIRRALLLEQIRASDHRLREDELAVPRAIDECLGERL